MDLKKGAGFLKCCSSFVTLPFESIVYRVAWCAHCLNEPNVLANLDCFNRDGCLKVKVTYWFVYIKQWCHEGSKGQLWSLICYHVSENLWEDVEWVHKNSQYDLENSDPSPFAERVKTHFWRCSRPQNVGSEVATSPQLIPSCHYSLKPSQWHVILHLLQTKNKQENTHLKLLKAPLQI